MAMKFRLKKKRKFLISRKRTGKRIYQYGFLGFSIFLILITVIILKANGEKRTKDFFIDNYIMDQGIYSSKEDAENNVDISEINWGLKEYCVVVVVFVDHGNNRISTSIALKVPMWEYLINTKSVRKKITITGEC